MVGDADRRRRDGRDGARGALADRVGDGVNDGVGEQERLKRNGERARFAMPAGAGLGGRREREEEHDEAEGGAPLHCSIASRRLHGS